MPASSKTFFTPYAGLIILKLAPKSFATVNLPKIPGGKKLIYTHVNLKLTALEDFEKLGQTDQRFKVLDSLVKENNGLWNSKAEKYLLENF